MRRTGHLFELPAPNPMRSLGQKLDDQGGCHDQKSERWAFEAFVQNNEREPRPGGSFRPRLQYRPNNYATRPALRRSSQLFPAFVWGTLAHKVARKRRSIDKLDAEDCVHSLKQHGDPWRLTEDLPPLGKDTQRRDQGEFMNRLVIVGILMISTAPLFAQGAQPDAGCCYSVLFV